MVSNKNIFCATNPANLLDALWSIVKHDGNDFASDVIFLPSRRAVRSAEKMFVDKVGSSVILPKFVALGEGAEDEEVSPEDDLEVVSNQERLIVLANLLSADSSIKTFASALPIANDLVRMQDYMENEGIDSADINWLELVDEKYAQHFQSKAKFLDISSKFLPQIFPNKITDTQKRNREIRNWIGRFNTIGKIVVCGSTGSVPASSDLMKHIAGLPNGYIILSGKISGDVSDFELNTNPYFSEYKFLKSINVLHTDVIVIDNGKSEIDFFNHAFGNTGEKLNTRPNAILIECNRESEEAETVAEIARRAVSENKTVLVITPDAAGNQRIAQSLAHANISADFSGGMSGTMTLAGRALLNLFDDMIENKDSLFDTEYKNNNFNLFETISKLIELKADSLSPAFEITSDESAAIWDAIIKLSDILISNGITLGLSDMRAVLSNALSNVSVRGQMNDNASVVVLGTIESRMQNADIVILTGLNEGMFPALGYENPWIPKYLSQQIGLPSGDRKVSLMSLDFMNLSCDGQVYWLRSKTAGSSQTTESRFISRVDVISVGIDRKAGIDILDKVRESDNVKYEPLDYSAPIAPADMSDVYVTELELLIHNPYAFYARHMLRLYPKKDYWEEVDARDFGNLVHSVIEKCSAIPSVNELVNLLDNAAKEILPPGSVIFHFWHKRFVDMADTIIEMLKISPNALVETPGVVKIAGRNVRAKADRIWSGNVLDIKTGAAPSKDKLLKGTMPQLPLEAYIMQQNGFKIKSDGLAPAIQFLQLKNNKIDLIKYESEIVQEMINVSVQKISELFGRYSKDAQEYEYRETSDKKYQVYDDLARVDD